MFELQDHQSVPKAGNRFAGQLVLALSCIISMVLVAWILLANFLQSNDKIEILPAGMSPEKADSFLRGLDEGRRALFAGQLRNEIQARPLNPEPIKKLAALAQTGSNVSEGDDLVMLAANRAWRDVALQSSALKLELDKRDYAAAISRLNIVYITQPDKEADVLKVLAGMTAAQSFDALVEALAQNPKWRSILLQTLAINPDVSIDVIYALFSALRHASSPPTQQELRVFIYRLVTTGAEDKGYFVWLDSLGPESLRKADFIHDGGFDLTLNNQFFSWTFDQMPGVDGRIASRTPGSIDKVFRLDFAPARSFFKNLSQYLKLPSGSYVLSGEVKTENLVSQVGLVWKLMCIGVSSEPLAKSKSFSGSQQWVSFETYFTVPEEGCGTQIIRLEVDAKADLDAQISGQAQFDNLVIARKK